MKIAVASGKGGTGKTTVTAALASLWPRPVTAVDLDVEEPNLHLFLKPEITGSRPAVIEIPEVDRDKCTKCGACASLCQFKAISVLGEVVLTFPELCHGCGGCKAVCPEGAVRTGFRTLGDIRWGRSGNIGFIMGRLRVSEAMSPPLIRQVRDSVPVAVHAADTDILFDSPPGVSCPAVHAVMDSDVILLVTEPTPFGVYDLKLAIEAFAPLGRPMGVVINRSGIGDDAVYDVCRNHGIDIFAEIPYDHDIAAAYADGRIVSTASPALRSIFVRLMDRITSYGEAHIDQGSPFHQR